MGIKLKNKLILSAVIGGLLTLWVMLRKSPVPTFIPAETTFHETFTIYSEGQGQLRAGEEYYLTVDFGGTIDKILQPQGATVKEGQVIAIVEEVKRKSELKSALSKYRLAAADFSRISTLYRSNTATRQEFDEASSKLSVERSELEKSKRALEDGIVRAPVDGVLSMIAFKTGDVVKDGSRIAIVEDLSSWQAVIKLPAAATKSLPYQGEFEISAFHYNLTDKADWKQLTGKIDFVNPNSNYDGFERDVKVVFKSPPEGYRSGQAVKIRWPQANFKNITLVEKISVIQDSKDHSEQVILLSKEHVPAWHKVEVLGQFKSSYVIAGLEKSSTIVRPMPRNDIDKVVQEKISINLKDTNTYKVKGAQL